MPQDVSNPLKLKLVMLFSVRNQTYCVCSHNLSAEEASQESEKLRRDGLPAFTVEQRSRHKGKRQKDAVIVVRMSSAPSKQSRAIQSRNPAARNGNSDPNLPFRNPQKPISQKLEVPHGK